MVTVLTGFRHKVSLSGLLCCASRECDCHDRPVVSLGICLGRLGRLLSRAYKQASLVLE